MAQRSIRFEHDEFTMKPTLDEKRAADTEEHYGPP